MMQDHRKYMTAREVAEQFRFAEKTLANWRALGQGPKFVKLGARLVRYRREDVEAFLADGGKVA